MIGNSLFCTIGANPGSGTPPRTARRFSIPGFVAGESGETTKARALAGELTGSLMSLKSMYGPERTAGRRWYAALEDLTKALEAFVPFAQVRRA